MILTHRFVSNGELCGIGVLFHGLIFTLTLNPSADFEIPFWSSMSETLHFPGFILQDSTMVVKKEIQFLY